MEAINISHTKIIVYADYPGWEEITINFSPVVPREGDRFSVDEITFPRQAEILRTAKSITGGEVKVKKVDFEIRENHWDIAVFLYCGETYDIFKLILDLITYGRRNINER